MANANHLGDPALVVLVGPHRRVQALCVPHLSADIDSDFYRDMPRKTTLRMVSLLQQWSLRA
jgi:hypothetical protein